MERVYLSRRNLLTLLSKLDRVKAGDTSSCSLIKNDNAHPKYSQTVDNIMVTAVEDEDYYVDRDAGKVHAKDEPKPFSTYHPKDGIGEG